jgi:hypothetical protein
MVMEINKAEDPWLAAAYAQHKWHALSPSNVTGLSNGC